MPLGDFSMPTLVGNFRQESQPGIFAGTLTRLGRTLGKAFTILESTELRVPSPRCHAVPQMPEMLPPTSSSPSSPPPQLPRAAIVIRPAQYRDLDTAERLAAAALDEESRGGALETDRPGLQFHPWKQLIRACSLFLHPHQYMFCAQPAGKENIYGLIHVSPFNRTRTTWRVDQVALDHDAINGVAATAKIGVTPADTLAVTDEPASRVIVRHFVSDVGSLLLRHCFEKIWEARTWLLDVNVNDNDALALYRQNGFQPLAQITHWAIAPAQLQELAEREPDLPNLLPVSNADAQLLYQLDTIAMPPLVRQVFDRHLVDFKTSLLNSLFAAVKNWMGHTEVISAYVFESQRKAAIGYFQVRLCRDGSQPHQAQLTVHPAYTWLYPELLCQMARITQEVPDQALQLTSADYHPEREEYLERFGAVRVSHTLMMSRSVWHKLRETKPNTLESLQLAEVLQGLKPARKPIPSRIAPLPIVTTPNEAKSEPPVRPLPTIAEPNGRNGKKSMLNLPRTSDFVDPPQEGPCC